MARPSTRRSAEARALVKRVTVTVTKHGLPTTYWLVTARVGGKQVGVMEIEAAKGHGGRYMKVAFAQTKKTGMGIGTKLYEAAARQACLLGRPLVSDSSRSKYSEGFWVKQAAKGRATCIKGSGRATRLTDEWDEQGSWPCGNYALSCPAPRSLAAIKKVR